MQKLLVPALCSLFLINCIEKSPTQPKPGSEHADPTGNTSGSPIEMEASDLVILRKSNALAKATGLPIKDARTQEILAKYLAKALAKALQNPQVGERVKGEIEKRFDGDNDALWSRLKNSPLGNGVVGERLRAEFSANAQATGIMEMFDQFRRLQVSIPKNIEKWDGKAQILVASVPFTKDDLNTDFLFAYDRNQVEYKLDGTKAPMIPVVVIGKNERTDDAEKLLGGIFVEDGNGSLKQLNQTQNPLEPITKPAGELRFGYSTEKSAGSSAPLKKVAVFNVTPKVPLNWERIIVYSDLEGWFMGGMEVRMHLLSDKEVALTAQKDGVYEDNNYHVNTFLRNINEDISRYIGTKFTEIDDNDWDKNFTFKLSADVAKIMKGVDPNGIANGDIGYNFGGDTDDDYIGENNKIELGSQDVSTVWTNGVAKVKFNYNPGIVEYDISSIPFVSASGNQGRGNAWDLTDQYGNNLGDGEDVTYRLIVPQNETNTYKISTCDALTNFDTMIQVFDKDRGTPYANDDDYSCPTHTQHSTVTAQLSGGTYYIVVDGFGGRVGSYKLSIQKI